MKKLLLALFLLSGLSTSLSAQFKAGALLGLSGTQIDGDGMGGFNKGGILGGIYVAYPFSKWVDGQFEMIFTQKGSHRLFYFDGTSQPGTWDDLKLNYIEVPVFAKVRLDKNWEAYAGLAAAYLIGSVYVPQGFGGPADANFLRQYDFSGLVGANYNFDPHWSATLRNAFSISTIGKGSTNSIISPVLVNRGLLNFVITGGVYYHFKALSGFSESRKSEI